MTDRNIDSVLNAITNVKIPIIALECNTGEIIYTNAFFNEKFAPQDKTPNSPIIKTTVPSINNLNPSIDTILFEARKNKKQKTNVSLKLKFADGVEIDFEGDSYYTLNPHTKKEQIFIAYSNKKQTLTNQATLEHFDVLHNIRDTFFYLNNKGSLQFVNRAFEKLINKTNEQLIGKNIWDIFPDVKNSQFARNYYKSLKENETIEFESFFPQINSWLSVLIYPSSDGISVFLHDITQKRRTDEILIESEKKFHLIADNSPMLIWTIDEKLKRTFFNKTFVQFAGITFGELLNKDWLYLVHSEEIGKLTIAFHRAYTYKTAIKIETRLLRHDGEYRWIKIDVTPQIDEHGNFNGFIGNGVDITALKYYYEKIEEKNTENEKALNESRRLSSILDKTSNLLVLTDTNGNITWVNEAFTKLTEYKLEEVIGKKPGPLVYGPETSTETMDLLRESIQKKEWYSFHQ